jgi:hypothetical protein
VGLPDRPWWDESPDSSGDPTWATRKLHRDVAEDKIELLPDTLQTCSATGEARAVMALWLAGQATDPAREGLRRAAAELGGPGYGDLLIEEHYDSTVPRFVPSFGSLTTADDVLTAVALLDLPDERVAAMVRSRWNDLIDPAAPPSLIFELLGEPVPPSAETAASGRGSPIPPMARCADLAESTNESP